MNFLEKELKKIEKNNSREKAFAFSFEKIEEELNSWIKRDAYSNKIINNVIDELKKDENFKQDNFLQIVDYTLTALEKIIESPKKSLIKISEFQDINKITVTDFKTMAWLGSKPGKNLVEKIGIKGKVLAPKNIYTIDKKENRIVTYYVKKVLEILELRFLLYNNNEIKSEKFQEIYKRFYRIKRKMILNEMFFLKRPLDFIPNNTLIDHRDYSIVNRGLNILKKYIKESEYTEKELIEKSLLVIFINIIVILRDLKNVRVVRKIFNIENILSSKEYSVDYFIEGHNFYHLKIKWENKKLSISLRKLLFNKKNKTVIEENRPLLNSYIELEILKKYDLEKNFLRFSIFGFPEEITLNEEGLKEIARNIVKNIVKKIEVSQLEKESEILEKGDKGNYINLNTPLSFFNDKVLENCVYSKKLNSFVGIEEYFSIEEDEELLSLSESIYNGENLEKVSKYLENLFNEALKIKEKEIVIFSSAEYQDSEIQKDIYTIFNSKFKISYPVWRSILATYVLDSKIKLKKESLVLDLNALAPSVNIVKKYGNIFEHHPILIEESENLKEFSLEKFIENYFYEYLKKYDIKIKLKEKQNILKGKKLNSILFFNEEKIFINREKKSFYIEKDSKIFDKVTLNMEKNFFNKLKKGMNKLNLKNKKVIIISDYILTVPDFFKNKIDINILRENQLGNGKSKILEKISMRKTVWNEFLPNLSLQTIKGGHFYNLNLIKDKSINLTLGEEIVFEVEDTLVFPVEQKIIKFPLYSEDSLNKKSCFLEVKSPIFPLETPLEVNLKIGYSYGKRNPYRIIVSTDDNQVEFETKWIEYKEEIEKKKINFPQIVVDDKEGEKILSVIWKMKRYCDKFKEYDKLAKYLHYSKNKFRKYLIKKVENQQLEEVLNNVSICYLRSLLDSPEIDEELRYSLNLFLSSFYNITSIEICSNNYHIEKRKFLFDYSCNNLKLKSFIDDKEIFKAIGIIAELSWLDREFIKRVSEKEPEVLSQCLEQVKKHLNYVRKNFDKKYRDVVKENELWKFGDSIRNSLEFLLALFLLEKEKNILFNEMKNIKSYYELLRNITEIDKKIQLETIKYPGLKKEFEKGSRIKIDIGQKEGLENVSDLVYSLYNYMTGSDGSNLIRVKEVVEE